MVDRDAGGYISVYYYVYIKSDEHCISFYAKESIQKMVSLALLDYYNTNELAYSGEFVPSTTTSLTPLL